MHYQEPPTVSLYKSVDFQLVQSTLIEGHFRPALDKHIHVCQRNLKFANQVFSSIFVDEDVMLCFLTWWTNAPSIFKWFCERTSYRINQITDAIRLLGPLHDLMCAELSLLYMGWTWLIWTSIIMNWISKYSRYSRQITTHYYLLICVWVVGSDQNLLDSLHASITIAIAMSKLSN